MTQTKRSLNKCKDCGDTWYPRGRDISNKCPNCGGTNIGYAGPGIGTVIVFVIIVSIVAISNRSKDQTNLVVDSQTTTAQTTTPTDAAPPISGADKQDNTETESKPQTESDLTLTPPLSVTAPPEHVTPDGSNFSPPTAVHEVPSQNNQGINNVTPSFDCAKAETDAARMICSSPTLSQADIELAELFNAVWQSTRDKQALLKEQIDWQTNVRDTCKDVPCMLDTYQSRTRYLANKRIGL